MTKMDIGILTQYGFDVEQGLSRCLHDEAFYRMILGIFARDNSFERAGEALAKNDHKALFASLHDLKGASGNAGMTGLYEVLCPLVELLRHDTGTQQGIEERFLKVEAAYTRALAGITRLMAEE